MVEISYKDISKGNFNLIDIRSSYQFASGNIPGSINILENILLLNPGNYLDSNQEYVIICDYGNRSLRVSRYLNTIGYKTYSLSGGYHSYNI